MSFVGPVSVSVMGLCFWQRPWSLAQSPVTGCVCVFSTAPIPLQTMLLCTCLFIWGAEPVPSICRPLKLLESRMCPECLLNHRIWAGHKHLALCQGCGGFSVNISDSHPSCNLFAHFKVLELNHCSIWYRKRNS